MPERVEVLKGVQKIISGHLKRPVEEIIEMKEIKKDLGADSLDEAEMIMQAEDRFKIDIPESKFKNIKTVGDLVTLIIVLVEYQD